MKPKRISYLYSVALAEEKLDIAEQYSTNNINKIEILLSTTFLERFFNRLVNTLDSLLKSFALRVRNLRPDIFRVHCRFDKLELFLIQLNYFVLQQRDLIFNTTTYEHTLPHLSSKHSAFYHFLDNLSTPE